jgi:hypothetical protein
MSDEETRLANPFSTGGGGHNFENNVQTTFAILMLSGGFVPCLPPFPIKKIKRHVGRVVSGRRNYVYSSATQIQMSNPVRPISETEKRSNSLQIYGHDLHQWKRRELRIAGAMI